MFICTVCNHGSTIKLGKCPSCNEFGTLEDGTQRPYGTATRGTRNKGGIILTHEGPQREQVVYSTNNDELRRVFPGGIVQGGVYLLAGEPGIGKSTLALHLLESLQLPQDDCMYCSGEEDATQVHHRMMRVTQRVLAQCYHIRYIEDCMITAQATSPKIIIIDSIQTVSSNESDAIAGSPSQVKFCSEQLSKRAKSNQITVVIIGHVTKDGEIAGPKYLEHIVDAVYYIEGERSGHYRFLRSKKNRFGSADEVAVFEMGTQGLQAVYNIHTKAIDAIEHNLPGTVVTMGLDSGRPILLYVETLITKMKGKYPQRVTLGIETTRLFLLLAIMEKYLQFAGGSMDVFVNIPGEFKGADAGLDMAVIVALWSQRKQKTMPTHTIFLGEVGLAGQILPARFHKKRKQDLPHGWSCIDHTVVKHIKEILHYI